MTINRLSWMVLAALAACASEEAPPADEDLSSALEFHGATVAPDFSMPDVDAIGYELDLTATDLTPARERYRARVRGTFVATRELAHLDLDFAGNDVRAVTAGTDALSRAQYTRSGDVMRITLPQPVARGAKVVVDVEYEGAFTIADGADPNDFSAFGGLMARQNNAEGKRIFASLGWPSKTRRFMPLRDHPRDGAMITMKLTFPASFEVRANGERKGVDTAGDRKTWLYEALTAMPPYDFHVAAYEGWSHAETTAPASGVRVTSDLYARDTAARDAVFADVPRAVDYLAATYGAYRFGSTVAFLEVPIFGGGMEHASVVSLDETLFVSPRETRLTAFHELAHHWSGNLVRIRTWNDFWLSEGFTDYLTGRVVAHVDGEVGARDWWAKLHRRAANADAAHALRPGGRDAVNEVDVISIFDDVSYKKGARILRMLEAVVGERALTAFLAKWFGDHAHAAMTTMDFERELAQAASQDLAPFFDAFVYGTGHPRLDAKVDANGLTVTNSGNVALPVVVVVSDGAREERVTMTTGVAKQLAFTPTKLVVDPDDVLYVETSCDSVQQCRIGYRCALGRCSP